MLARPRWGSFSSAPASFSLCIVVRRLVRQINDNDSVLDFLTHSVNIGKRALSFRTHIDTHTLTYTHTHTHRSGPAAKETGAGAELNTFTGPPPNGFLLLPLQFDNNSKKRLCI